MTLNNTDYVARGLDLLAEALPPFIASTLAPQLPESIQWTDLLERRDETSGIIGKPDEASDLQVLLRALTEPLGTLGQPFDALLGRPGIRYISELRDIRTDWAHNVTFADEDAYRAVDTTQRLLALLRLPQAAPAAELRRQLQVELTARSASDDSTPSEAGHPPVDDSAASGATVTVSCSPVISYAMAHNRIPVVSQLVIHTTGPSVQAAQLTISISTAGGTLGEPREFFVDLVHGEDTYVQQVNFVLDPIAMAQIEESRPATVMATVVAGSTVIARHVSDVRVLAANEWMGTPVESSMEMLSAYVQPNDPALAALVDEASILLEQATGRGSFDDGYADGSDGRRIDEIVDALMSAMRARSIRYAMPPASWAEFGQKVRTASEVLEGRLGTCLDTSVVLAAALERVGVHPLVFVTKNHAFLGYWRLPGALPSPAVTESGQVAQVINAVGLRHIAVLESTLLTIDGADSSPQQIRASAWDTHLQGDLSHIVGIADVRVARTSRIYPLPATTMSPDGAVTITGYDPTRSNYERYSPAAENPGTATPDRQKTPPRVAQWKNNLLDLSLRNRLINFPASARLQLAVPAEGLGQFEDYLNANQSIELLAADAVSAVDQQRGISSGAAVPTEDRLGLLTKKQVYSDITTEAYARRFRALAYKAKTIVEETGANNLYATIGSLVWTLKDREVRSPLILIPVTLKPRARGGAYQLSLDEAGASTPNYCLLEKLRIEFGVSIPGLTDPVTDSSGIDIDATLRATREAIAASGIPARVEETVNLAILQFAKFRLWKDLDENWEEFSENALVRHLIQQPQDAFVDPAAEITRITADVDLDELLTQLPVSADSSQLNAVAAATSGRTFVLEGPPGTGKSQTITNLLAKAIAEGRRVLFVAEKKAALDVVQKRLAAVGLGPFTLDLHDRGSRPNEIRSHLKKALAAKTSVDEDGLKHTTSTVDIARRSLARYNSQLHERNRSGLSFYSAHNAALATSDAEFTLPVTASWAGSATSDTLHEIRTLLRDVPDLAVRVRPGFDPAWGFVDVVGDEAVDPVEIIGLVDAFDAAIAAVSPSDEINAALREVSTVEQLRTIASLAQYEPISAEVLAAIRTPAWQDATGALAVRLDTIAAEYTDVLAVVAPHILALDLAALSRDATAAAQSSFFGRKKRLLAVAQRFSTFLLPDQQVAPAGLAAFTARLLALQASATELAGQANAAAGLSAAAQWNPYLPDQRDLLLDTITGLNWIARNTDDSAYAGESGLQGALDRLVTAERTVDSVTTATLEVLADAYGALAAAPGTSEASWDHWRSGRRLLDAWDASRPGRQVDGITHVPLPAWIAWRRVLAPLRSGGLGEAYHALLTGVVPADYATPAFERGFAEAASTERQATTGLTEFDAVRHNRQIERFTESSRELRDMQLAVAPHRVVGRRSFDPLTAGGRVGLLQKQLDRQRGGMSVRELMINFSDLIVQATPCILVSPDSVARFFPAQAGLFDIVVFDEASQVRVADAVGAMGRATSVVVVGDSKQMPPTAFAEASTTDDDDQDLDADGGDFLLQDEESILAECVQARVERQYLSWHYRSQDESLIAFSNRYYYDEQLTSFPAPAHNQVDAGVGGHGISLVRVDGTFLRSGPVKERRTNRAEANAIVAEITQRFAATAEGAAVPSVGVVTFNAQQRTLIETLLRDLDDERIAEALDAKSDGLFVKNLENVQGDERDTILFSTAFSANDKGVLPLNFGPLTTYGGERRLNVAITRARRQVIVFSSFDPGDLRADETNSRGIKDLRAYLEVAQKGAQHTLRGRTGPVTTDRHREQIAERLRELGYEVTTDVGLSDFRIDLVVAPAADPLHPVLAVLLDGTAWSMRRTVADRDALPVDVLEGLMHWPSVARVWLPEWLSEPDAVLDRLAGEVDNAALPHTAEQVDAGAEA
ncbi:MAG: putative helicase [Glaciihabitans sp.]|nr:putative helicase [Glaciihabitans sp.]